MPGRTAALGQVAVTCWVCSAHPVPSQPQPSAADGRALLGCSLQVQVHNGRSELSPVPTVSHRAQTDRHDPHACRRLGAGCSAWGM